MMTTTTLISGLATLLLAGSATSDQAAPARRFAFNTQFRSAQGSMVDGVRCATVERPTRALRQSFDSAVRSGAYIGALDITIPVAFHVITNNSGQGNVPVEMLEDQIEVLNASYAEMGIQFDLASVDVTANTLWYTTGPDTNAEVQMKTTLAIDPAHTFNVYVSNPGGGLLGWATFPWYYDESDPLHGVVILNSSLPGGDAFPYDEGDTLTHEAGHYLGLFHTFQNGCRRPGDFVSDTPFEREPAFGCPVSRDTCGSAGVDPIFNFMDYSDDACMEEFTPDQQTMINWATGRFKPSLGL